MADEDKGQEDTKSENSEAKPKKSKLGIIFALVDLVVMVGGAFVVYSSTLGYKPKVFDNDEAVQKIIAEREEKAADSVLFMMDPISINLAGTPKRQLTVEMHLEMLDGNGFEEVVKMGAETRDAIMKLLEEKTFYEIESVQGKLFLKDQIATQVNHFLKQGIVKDIFFSQFIVE